MYHTSTVMLMNIYLVVDTGKWTFYGRQAILTELYKSYRALPEPKVASPEPKVALPEIVISNNLFLLDYLK